jgi:mono/diheme cytochrome c family protein
MQRLTRIIPAASWCFVVVVTTMQAQSDPATTFKTNCVACHGAHGGADTPAGKAVHAKDLRSEEIQEKSASEIAEVITNGNGKMPAFGSKLSPADIKKLAAYVRTLGKEK